MSTSKVDKTERNEVAKTSNEAAKTQPSVAAKSYSSFEEWAAAVDAITLVTCSGHRYSTTPSVDLMKRCEGWREISPESFAKTLTQLFAMRVSGANN